MDTKAATTKLNKAKIALMTRKDSTFFSTVCLSLRHEFADTISTADCNGTRVRYSPAFLDSLTIPEVTFLMLHETLHAAYLHIIRSASKDRKKFNYAADYVINLQLVKMGYTMPQGGLIDYAYEGMSVEEVYKIIPDPPEDYEPDLTEPGDDGTPDPNSKEGQSEAQAKAHEKLQKDMDKILVRAAVQSRMSKDSAGAIPGDLQRYLDSLINPRLPWYQLLRRLLNKVAKNDYSWRRPNRRYFPDHILPSQHSEVLADIAVATDVSGSVTKAQFNHFISEAASIIRSMRPKNLSFIQFDTEIKSVDMINSLNDLKKVKFTGHGGTNLNALFQWAQEHKPHILIIFTDGKFRMPEQKLSMPVFWVIHSNANFTAPQGKVIHYNFD